MISSCFSEEFVKTLVQRLEISPCLVQMVPDGAQGLLKIPQQHTLEEAKVKTKSQDWGLRTNHQTKNNQSQCGPSSVRFGCSLGVERFGFQFSVWTVPLVKVSSLYLTAFNRKVLVLRCLRNGSNGSSSAFEKIPTCSLNASSEGRAVKMHLVGSEPDSRVIKRDKLKGTTGAKFAVFFYRFSLIFADFRFSWELQHLGGAEFHRKPVCPMNFVPLIPPYRGQHSAERSIV